MLKKLLSAVFMHNGYVAFSPASSHHFVHYTSHVTVSATDGCCCEPRPEALCHNTRGEVTQTWWSLSVDSGGSAHSGLRRFSWGRLWCVTRRKSEGEPGEARRQKHLRQRVGGWGADGGGAAGWGRREEALRHVVCACDERWPPIIWGL